MQSFSDSALHDRAIRHRAMMLLCFAATAIAMPVGAQTTNCSVFGNTMNCNTTQPLPPTDWAAIGRNFNAALEAGRQKRAAANAQMVAQAYEAAASRAASAEAQRESERAAAMQRLFVDRWMGTVKQIAESLQVAGEVAQRMDARITPTAIDLFKVNPQATTSEMRDALQPHLVYLNGWFNSFLRTVVAVQQPALDSLRLTPPEVQIFVAAVRPVAQNAFMMAPDQGPAAFRATHLEPLLQRARVYFDSVRTVVADSARRVSPAPARRAAPRRP